MEPTFASLNADCARLIFQQLESYDIPTLARTGCKSMRQRIFSCLESLHIPFDATRRVGSPSSFIAEFTALKTLILGELNSKDGPFIPGLDLTKLPPSITHLELNIANGNLALFKLSGQSFNASSHGTTCLPLKTILPNLQHFHTLNGYRINYDPFVGLDLLDEISELPLLSLTYSPLHTTLSSLNKLPSTLVALTIDCTNWMKSESVVKVKWPKSLKSLEFLNVDGDLLDSLDMSSLPTQLERLRIVVDDFKTEKMKAKLDLENLPATLLSLHIRYITLSIPKSTLDKLPPRIDELRLFIWKILDGTTAPFIYELMPRSLRTLYLYSAEGSPKEGAYYDNLPRGLVDFGCDRPFGLHAPPPTPPQGNAQPIATRAPQPALLPISLVRSRITPPQVDCRPDDLIPASLRQYQPNIVEDASSAPSDGPAKGEGAGMVEETEEEKASSEASKSAAFPVSITDIDLPVGTCIMEFEERLKNAKRINLTESGSEVASRAVVDLVRSLNIDTLQMGSNNNNKTIMEITNPKTEPRPTISTLIIDHGRDGFVHANWSLLSNGPLATLQTLEYPLKFYTAICNYMPPTLTELSLIRPRTVMDEEIYTSIIEVMGRPLEMFRSFPRTLLRLRCSFPYLYEGNIFALLPPKLQELHLLGCKAGFTQTSPNIPVDQLFHLPTSLTRLTLPAYDKMSEGIRLYSVADVELLQRFFAERPQLRTFSIWKKNYAKHAFGLKNPNALCSRDAMGPYEHDPDWLFITYSAPSRASRISQDFHPASSLDIALKSALSSAGIPIASARATKEAPKAEPSSPAPEAKKTKEKKEKAKGGGFFSRLFGKSSEPAKPVEEPISAASTSEAPSAAQSFVYRKPENEKTVYKPQLDFDAISSLASAPGATFTQIVDSATSTDNGYAEFWADETIKLRQAAEAERRRKKK